MVRLTDETGEDFMDRLREMFGPSGGAPSGAGSRGGAPSGAGSGGGAAPAKPWHIPYGAGAGGGGVGWDTASKLIQHFESGGRNVMNNMADATHTAGGYFQITNSTWRQFAPLVPNASAYSSAISAPYAIQSAVAKAIYEYEGFAPWANYDAPLAAALSHLHSTRLGDNTIHHHGSPIVTGHSGDTHITVNAHGNAAPNAIARSVADRQRRVVADAIRYLTPVFS
jgi:hypothetical protein